MFREEQWSGYFRTLSAGGPGHVRVCLSLYPLRAHFLFLPPSPPSASLPSLPPSLPSLPFPPSSQQTVGVITRMEKEVFKVLTQHGKEQSVKQHSVQLRKTRAVALDSHQVMDLFLLSLSLSLFLSVSLPLPPLSLPLSLPFIMLCTFFRTLLLPRT